MTTKKTIYNRISASAIDVIESITKRYFALLMESYVSIESSLDLRGKILIEFTPFLNENNFIIDNIDFINDSKAIIYLSVVYNDLVRLECKVNALYIDGILVLNQYEIITVKRIRKRN